MHVVVHGGKVGLVQAHDAVGALGLRLRAHSGGLEPSDFEILYFDSFSGGAFYAYCALAEPHVAVFGGSVRLFRLGVFDELFAVHENFDEVPRDFGFDFRPFAVVCHALYDISHPEKASGLAPPRPGIARIVDGDFVALG